MNSSEDHLESNTSESSTESNTSESNAEHDLFDHLVQEIAAWPLQEGIRTTDLTMLNEPLRGVLNATVREGSMTLPDFAQGLGLSLERAEQVVDLLLEHGFLRSTETPEEGETEYRVRYARAGRNVGDLWRRVTDKIEDKIHRLELNPQLEHPPETPLENKE